ncbi:MAG: hypothetical protein KC800_08505 [Candidatus Eremiobacteraeota bacterium]|nr:hypothetical protein [Candidatus Eremiobacteraeota bacterium]
MKQNLVSKFFIMVAALVLASCANPANPSRPTAGETGTPAAPATATQLQQAWTLINFGAPW